MTTALALAAGLVVYLAVGAVYARANSVRYYQRIIATGKRNHPSLYQTLDGYGYRHALGELHSEMMVAFLLWPGRMVYDFAVGPAAEWAMAPLNDRRARADRSRADADKWRALATTGTPAERAMAPELARICDELADTLEI